MILHGECVTYIGIHVPYHRQSISWKEIIEWVIALWGNEKSNGKIVIETCAT